MHLTDERLSVTASACDLGRIPAHANVIDAVREKKTESHLPVTSGSLPSIGEPIATREHRWPLAGSMDPQAFRGNHLPG